MSVINMARNIKQVHPDSVICYKVGTFYNSYGKDAYIISYIFNYQIRHIAENIAMVSFPKNSISKVTSRLDREKINYIVIDTRNNYDIDKKEEFKNLNKYQETLQKSKKIVNLRLRVNKISEKFS